MTLQSGNLPSLPPVYDPARADRTLQSLQRIFSPDQRALLAAAAGNSSYLARTILKEEQFLQALFASGPETQLAMLMSEAVAAGAGDQFAAVQDRLRVARRRAAIAIALPDIAGQFDVMICTSFLTRFADACIAGALNHLVAAEAQRESTGSAVSPENCGLIVLAMGKMGAFELNYSSDIDLVVFFDDSRFPFMRAGDRQRAAVEMTRSLVRLISEHTAAGYVFRVDLRLRPDAGATQVAISTEAAESYYEAMGQNWERAAWIKARQCGGDREAGAAFLRQMQPFVWRRHLDYAAIQDIHSIKRQIHSHAGHGRIAVAGHNIKLGRGGIREIEFFVQTQQLILGGRDPGLRQAATLAALAALRSRGHISAEAETQLSDAYLFLRVVEHRLQMIEDQQTHTLPKSPDGLDHVARFCGFDDTNAFEESVRRHLTHVQSHYARLFEAEEPLSDRTGSLVFTGVEEDPETVATLSRMGFANAAGFSSVIRGWHHGRIRATRSARARELLTRLIPSMLKALSGAPDPDSAFMHFDRFLSGLPAGVQLFSMLLANPRLLEVLAEIAGSAPRLSDYLGRNPGVLDVLIDPGFLSHAPSAEQLESDLGSALSAADTYESALNAARRFAREEMFRTGARLIIASGPPSEAGPAYSAIAETVLGGLQPLVENAIASAHGRIAGGELAVIAMGKLGGREMTATSDLDLVFVYDAPSAQSEGNNGLPVTTWFGRLSQRYISALTALTGEGRLYDVDMRLRPSGNQGPAAVSFERFLTYHLEHSWTWEKMALTRARVVAGPAMLRERVSDAISMLLSRPCESPQTRLDASEMRRKLQTQFPARTIWDLKFARGGLVDIEFTVQVAQLCHPDLPGLRDQNTIAAAEKLVRAGLLDAAEGDALIAAARLQQDLTQVLRVAVDGEFRGDSATAGVKALLTRTADIRSFDRLEALLQSRQAAAHTVFRRVIGE